MQTTRNLHDQIVKVGFGIPEHILHDMAAFHSGNDMFNENANPRNHHVFRFVFGRQLLPAWLSLGLIRLDMVRLIALKTGILE
jgi:hypothetical protein